MAARAFTTYYELKDENKKLPKNCRFEDPIDGRVFTSQEYPTLEKMLEAVTDHRLEILKDPYREDGNKHLNKNYARHAGSLVEQDPLKLLVVAFLYETTPNLDRDKYFVNRAALPTFAAVVNFTSTLAREYISNHSVPIQTRQTRAKSCLTCNLHDKRGGGIVNKFLRNVVDTLTKTFIQNSTTYEEESKLGTCRACGCGLQSKVKFGIVNVVTGLFPEQLVSILRVFGKDSFKRCWVLSDALSNAQAKKLLFTKFKGNTEYPTLGEVMYRAYVQDEIDKLKGKSNG